MNPKRTMHAQRPFTFLLSYSHSVQKRVYDSEKVATFITKIQSERSTVAFNTFVINAEKINSSNVRETMEERFRETDLALDSIEFWNIETENMDFTSKLKLQIRIDDFREKISNLETFVAVDGVMDFYGQVTSVMLDFLSESIRKVDNRKGGGWGCSFCRLKLY